MHNLCVSMTLVSPHPYEIRFDETSYLATCAHRHSDRRALKYTQFKCWQHTRLHYTYTVRFSIVSQHISLYKSLTSNEVICRSRWHRCLPRRTNVSIRCMLAAWSNMLLTTHVLRICERCSCVSTFTSMRGEDCFDGHVFVHMIVYIELFVICAPSLSFLFLPLSIIICTIFIAVWPLSFIVGCALCVLWLSPLLLLLRTHKHVCVCNQCHCTICTCYRIQNSSSILLFLYNSCLFTLSTVSV